jgi:hypothetical protein
MDNVTVSRTFGPSRREHLSREQLDLYMQWADFVQDQGTGSVEVIYSNHHPMFLSVHLKIRLPDPGGAKASAASSHP